MSVITRQEKIDGKWFTWITYDGMNCLLYETDEQMTEEEAQIKLDESLAPLEEPNGTTN